MLPNDIRLECFDRAAQFFRYLTERDLPSKGRRLPKKASARKTPDIKRVTSGADVFDFHTVNGFNSNTSAPEVTLLMSGVFHQKSYLWSRRIRFPHRQWFQLGPQQSIQPRA